MSLLAQVNQPSGNPTATGAPQYYFALDSSPAEPEVTAPAFVAIGTGSPSNGGSFTAKAQDLTGAGSPAFIMDSSGSVARFAIGLDGIEAGANSGSNLTIFSYADNGSFLGGPLSINRATGNVTMPENLTVGDSAVGGAVLNVDGSLGPSRVYDGIYNPPPAAPPALAPQIDFIVTQSSPFPASPLPAGATTSTVGAVFQVPTTGLYVLGGSVGINSAVGETFTCADGDFVSLQLATVPVGGLQGGVSIDITPIPLGIEVDRAWNNTNVVKLTGLVNYQCSLSVYNLSGTMAYSAGNTVTSAITLAALC